MARRLLAAAVGLALALPSGCDTADQAHQSARDVSQHAVDASQQAVDASKKAVGDASHATRQSAQTLLDLTPDGSLSETAEQWLAQQAEQAKGTDIESIVHTGVQLAPVALEASRVLAKAVDSTTVVEPIFQRIDDDPATVDAAIGDMPRVEIIEGVTIGFQKMDQLDAHTSIEQRGYLVMWRHEEHLVGFVYRSTRTIDLETLIAETPRLVTLSQRALDEK